MPTPTTAELQEAMRTLDTAVQDFISATNLKELKLDGHTVGLVGELIAQLELGMVPNQDKSTKGFDGWVGSSGGERRKLEVKATQAGPNVAFRGETPECEEVVVYKLDFNKGEWERVYYGLARPVWNELSPVRSNGQRTISLTRLRELQEQDPSTAE